MDDECLYDGTSGSITNLVQFTAMPVTLNRVRDDFWDIRDWDLMISVPGKPISLSPGDTLVRSTEGGFLVRKAQCPA